MKKKSVEVLSLPAYARMATYKGIGINYYILRGWSMGGQLLMGAYLHYA